jgi:hypothetical protein
MTNRIVFRPDEIADIIHAFVENRESTSSIGRRYGVSVGTIIKALRENDVEVSLSDRRKVHFTDTQRKDIVRRYAAGLGQSPLEISKEYGCCSPTVIRVLKEEGAYNQHAVSNRVLFSRADYDAILRLYAEGESANAISKMFGCRDGIILSLLHENNIDTHDYGRGKRTNPVRDRGWWKTCRGLSRVMYKRHRVTINPNKLEISKYGYHLDHRIPISIGYASDLTVLDLAHPCNLQVITAVDNLSKATTPDLSKQTLLNKIKRWNKLYGDPFRVVDMEIEYHYRYGRYRFFGGEFRYNWGVR